MAGGRGRGRGGKQMEVSQDHTRLTRPRPLAAPGMEQEVLTTSL